MAVDTYFRDLALMLTHAGLVPGSAPLIPDDFEPTTKLIVRFGTKDVLPNSFFRAGECKLEPTITFEGEKPEFATATYTFALLDPDAPTPDDPKFAYWRHLVRPGLRSSNDGTSIESKPALTEYLAPGPKDDSKPHRYLFLLFREPENLELTKEDVGGEEFTQRRSFKAAEFAQKHNLKLVAVNFMRCAGDGWQE